MPAFETTYFFYPHSDRQERHPVIANLRPLTRQAAKRMGHVAWIDEKDPTRAIRAMVKAAFNRGSSCPPPYNCAIWPHANIMSTGDRAFLSAWRTAMASQGWGVGATYQQRQEIPDLKETFRSFALSGLKEPGYEFSEEDHERALAIQQRGIEMRVQQIIAALNPSAIKYDHKFLEYKVAELNLHVDGRHTGDSFRLAETPCGMPTLVFDHAEVEFYTLPSRDEAVSFCKPRGESITGWITPPESLILISNRANHPLPIAHGFPLTSQKDLPNRAAHPDEKRIFSCYGVRM